MTTAIPNALLELRTKSTQVRQLLELETSPGCVTAFSFTPQPVSAVTEHGVPAIPQRLEAMSRLQQQGWPVGLRLDPLIDCDNFEALYRDLIQTIFSMVDADRIHSVSYGSFRMPQGFFDQMVKLYPEEPIFARNLRDSGGMVSYGIEREQDMRDLIKSMLLEYIDADVLFPCIN